MTRGLNPELIDPFRLIVQRAPGPSVSPASAGIRLSPLDLTFTWVMRVECCGTSVLSTEPKTRPKHGNIKSLFLSVENLFFKTGQFRPM